MGPSSAVGTFFLDLILLGEPATLAVSWNYSWQES